MRAPLFLFLFLFPLCVQAQVPQIFSYQGVLANTDGTALPDGAHTLVVRLYDAGSGGDALWEETHELTTVSGVFSVVLGSVEAIELVFDRPYYLGVSVDGAAEPSPRIPLTASPYSLGSKTTVAEPESGQSFAVRSETGATAHVLSSDGSATHAGKGTFQGGLIAGLAEENASKAVGAAKNGSAAAETTAGSFSGDVEILNNPLLDRPSQLRIEELEEVTDATGILVWNEEDKVVRYARPGELSQPPGGGGELQLPFSDAVDEAVPAFEAENAGGAGILGRSTPGPGVRGENAGLNTSGELGSTLGGVFGLGGGPETGGTFVSEEGFAGVFFGDVAVNDRDSGDPSFVSIDTMTEDPDEDNVVVWDGDGTAGVTGALRVRSLASLGSGVPWRLDDADAIVTNNDVDIKDGALVVGDEVVDIQSRTLQVAPGGVVMDGVVAITGEVLVESDDSTIPAVSVSHSDGIGVSIHAPTALFTQGEIFSDGDVLVHGDVSIQSSLDSPGSLHLGFVEEDATEEKFLVWDDDGTAGEPGVVRFRTLTSDNTVPWFIDSDNAIATHSDVNIQEETFSVVEGMLQAVGRAVIMRNLDGDAEDGVAASKSSLAGGALVEITGRTVMKPPLGMLFPTLDVESVSETAVQASSVAGKAGNFDGDLAINDFGGVSLLTIETVEADPDEEKFLVWDDDGSSGVAGAVRYATIPGGSGCVTCDEDGATIEGALRLTPPGSSEPTITIDPSNTEKSVQIINSSSEMGLGINVNGTGVSSVSFGANGTGGQFVAAGEGGVGLRAVASGVDAIALEVFGNSFQSGNASITGDLFVSNNVFTGGSGITIDHPLDPANRTLRHAAVESSEMMNVYNGNVVLDGAGEAWVELPEWFEALNADFRYQLTCIGGFAQVFVAETVVNNRFKIAGGSAGLQVSWQVTGIRNDPYARAHPLQVQTDKPFDKRGEYLHPESYRR